MNFSSKVSKPLLPSQSLLRLSLFSIPFLSLFFINAYHKEEDNFKPTDNQEAILETLFKIGYTIDHIDETAAIVCSKTVVNKAGEISILRLIISPEGKLSRFVSVPTEKTQFSSTSKFIWSCLGIMVGSYLIYEIFVRERYKQEIGNISN
jgi:hypothetical protein